MQDYCKNCGATIQDGARFCPDCGSAVEVNEKVTSNFCENCGKQINPGEDFCSECGHKLNGFEAAGESFLKKYRIPLIIAAAAAVLIIAGIAISGMLFEDATEVSLPPQTVTVGAEYFEIPGDYIGIPSSIDVENSGAVVSFSQSWKNDLDTISIAILTSGYSADLESVAAAGGGVHKTMMGYDGYYIEHDVYDYSFTFVLDNKICVIETTSPHVFDEIKVL